MYRSLLIVPIASCLLLCFLLPGHEQGQATATVITPYEIRRVKSSLQRALGERSIPDGLNKWMAILQKHLYILNCLPTRKVSSKCHSSPSYCSIPTLKLLGQPLKIKLSICKHPWKIIIHFQLPKLPWYARAYFGPVVIPINHYNNQGVTKIDSETTGKASVLGIFNVFKATLKINAFIRWDCTKPVNKMYERVGYNSQYNDGKPGLDYNKLYYKLKIRIEIKKKRFPCFCYRCKRCEDLINKQGHFGEGPQSCIADANRNRPVILRKIAQIRYLTWKIRG
eukprot:gene4724-5347_t